MLGILLALDLAKRPVVKGRVRIVLTGAKGQTMLHRMFATTVLALLVSIAVLALISCASSSSSSATTHPAAEDNDDNDTVDDDDDTSDDDASPDDDDDSSPDDDDDTAETVWTDSTTGSMWQNGATVGSDNYDQPDAESYCTGLTWGGYSGWSLPDIDQLRSLIQGCPATGTGGSCDVTDSCLLESCENDSCGGCSDGGPGPGGAYWPPEITGNVFCWYWSSLGFTDDTGSYGWGVYFSSADITYAGVANVEGNCARCVRSSTDGD